VCPKAGALEGGLVALERVESASLLISDSARIERLKERLLSAPYEICLERAKHFTSVYRQTEDMHPALRNALALKATCENQPVHIYADEWLVGNKTDCFLSPVIAPERGDSLRSLELEMEVLADKGHPFRIKPEDRKAFEEEILPYWEGRCLRDLKAARWVESGIIEPVRGNPFRTIRQVFNMLSFARKAGRENLRVMAGIKEGQRHSPKRALTAWKRRDELSRNNPNMGVYCYDVQGHLHLGVENVVREGFAGIAERAAERLGGLDPDREDYEDGKAFLEAVMTSMDAACIYAGRLRSLAEAAAAEAEDPAERDRLTAIAASLEHAPERPARTFREGVQAVWFALMIGEMQYGMHEVFGIGRVDQYLYPLYEKGMEEGRLGYEEALELLEELNLKLTANVSLIPEIGAEANGTLGVSQHCIAVGGQDASGADATNALSYAIIDAYERMHGAINQLSLRVHRGSPPGFLERGVRVFRAASGHAFFNDEVIVPALERDGLSPGDARDYNIVGCIETSGGGNCFGCPGGHEVVLPIVLYMTMTNGRIPVPVFGQKRSIKTGEPDSFNTFASFMKAFRLQLEHNIEVLVKAVEGKDRAYMEFLPAPYVSALTDGCIESATDVTRGGAPYDFTSVIGRGLATCADSLMAIKEFVFDRRELSLSELVDACLSNFKGREDLRQRLINVAPKYGRDEKDADAMARWLVDTFTDLAEKHTNARGGRFRAGMYSYGNHVIDGFYVGATPDGRRRGEPISNGISPSNRVGEGNGLTAYMRSASALGQGRLSGGVSLNVKLHPAYIEGDEGLRKMTSLLETYFEMGGMHVQPNVISDATLLAAQDDPDSYRDLVVKVAGYSAYFTDLGRSIQDDIIDRYQFGAPI
jgi:pyruvate formate-lyase/glycerol dehydratase family glycyl radical enzyme